MTTTTILEVRDAFVATLGSVAPVAKTTASPVSGGRGIVVGSGEPWFRVLYANGPTQLGREWNWEITPVVSQKRGGNAFDGLARLIEDIIDALLADHTLGGVVEHATVDQIGVVENRSIGGTPDMLTCTMRVGVVS